MLNLVKGGTLSLGRAVGGVDGAVRAELQWDDRLDLGTGVDLDVSVIVVGHLGRALSDAHFVYYNNPLSPDGAVRHRGDAVVGAADREVVELQLGRASDSVRAIVLVASVHDADSTGHNFGQVVDAVIRLVDADTGRDLGRYELSEEASTATAVVFGQLTRHGADGSEWTFQALGEARHDGLEGVLLDHAVNMV